MKKITLILTPLLFLLGLNAEVMKPENISGNTMQQYSKPGAPIDMKYNSQRVDLNETADVNITLNTSATNGTFSAIVTLDKELEELSDTQKELKFDIYEDQQEFMINLKVKAQDQGLYYIRLLTKISNSYGSKLRSFAVPVYIGEEEKKVLTKGITNQFKALGSGENISVSKAIETIKVLKD